MKNNVDITPFLDLQTPGSVVALHVLSAIIQGYQEKLDDGAHDKMGAVSVDGRAAPCIYIEWISGGYEGGSSEGGQLYEREAEKAERPRIIYDLFKMIAPQASFTLYEDVLSSYRTSKRTENGYHGNTTEYEIAYLPISTLLEKLAHAGIRPASAFDALCYASPALGLEDFAAMARQCASKLKNRSPSEWAEGNRSVAPSIPDFWKEVNWVDRDASKEEISAFGRRTFSGFFLPNRNLSTSLPDLTLLLLSMTNPNKKYSIQGLAKLLPPILIVEHPKTKPSEYVYLDVGTLYAVFLGYDWMPSPKLKAIKDIPG